MAGNITFTIIKPGAVAQEHIGPILSKISEAGFRIMALKFFKLRIRQAEVFYNIHKEKPFFDSLIKFMISGPIVVAILEKENAVEEYRKLIGSTNPEEAEEGTIRKLFAESVQRNGNDKKRKSPKASGSWPSNFWKYRPGVKALAGWHLRKTQFCKRSSRSLFSTRKRRTR